jgi:ABC-type sugar transport system substrate-binding protein
MDLPGSSCAAGVDSKSYQSAFKKAREAPGLVFSWARRKKSVKNASYAVFVKDDMEGAALPAFCSYSFAFLV